jgi:hypothetical protein
MPHDGQRSGKDRGRLCSRHRKAPRRRSALIGGVDRVRSIKIGIVGRTEVPQSILETTLPLSDRHEPVHTPAMTSAKMQFQRLRRAVATQVATLPFVPRRKSPAVEWMGSAALVAKSIVVALAVLELTCRVSRGPAELLDWSNLATRLQAQSDEQMVQQFLRDPSLGYVPRPNFHAPTANHDGQGFRETPATSGDPLAMPQLLASGDSNVYGDEVEDTESWPSALQEFIHRRVYNAGVNAYGFDQSVLRTEQQAAALKPAAIVISFIADDLRRSFAVYGARRSPTSRLRPERRSPCATCPYRKKILRSNGHSGGVPLGGRISWRR